MNFDVVNDNNSYPYCEVACDVEWCYLNYDSGYDVILVVSEGIDTVKTKNSISPLHFLKSLEALYWQC